MHNRSLPAFMFKIMPTQMIYMMAISQTLLSMQAQQLWANGTPLNEQAARNLKATQQIHWNEGLHWQLTILQLALEKRRSSRPAVVGS